LQVTLDWWDNPNAITPVEILAQDTQAWVDAERQRLLAPLRQHLRRASQSLAGMLAISGSYESRSAEEYQQEVEDYVTKAAQVRPRQVHRMAILNGLGAMELAVENDTMYNFPAVEVRLAFPAEATPYLDEDDALPYSEIPQPPEPFGSNALARSLLGLHGRPHFFPATPITGPQSYIEQSTQMVHFAPVHVRPNSRHRLPRIHLIVGPAAAGSELIGEWSATSTGVSGQVTGTLSFAIGRTPMSFGAADLSAEEMG
jgi:hypothetical protein